MMRANTLAASDEPMFPLSVDNPIRRAPVVTIGILVLIGAAWIFVQWAAKVL
jgi:hypothetical protein